MGKIRVNGDERFEMEGELYAQQPKFHDLASMPILFTPSISNSFYGGPQEPSHKKFMEKVELYLQNYGQTMEKSDNDDNKSTFSYDMVN